MIQLSRLSVAFVPLYFSALFIQHPIALAASDSPNSRPDLPVRIDETPLHSALHDMASGDLLIEGHCRLASYPDSATGPLRLRVTTHTGATFSKSIDPTHGAEAPGSFTCRYPTDFDQAARLVPGFLFIDAYLDVAGEESDITPFQAEATVIVHDSRGGVVPEFPSAFTNDLLDAKGTRDTACYEWPTIRSLVNLYMHSRAAEICEIGRSGFDLQNPDDLQWFKNNMTLYEFDYRDRDWNSPLNHRVRRTFWQAVWDNWFDASNNNPLDGDDTNNDPSNFIPYAFANDFCDTLVLYLLRLDRPDPLDDNLDQICREGLWNLIQFQHREPSNFAKMDQRGRRHTYTKGAFHYGMFEDGRFMTEGVGWFYDPAHEDYVNGGVFNARSLWAVGEGLTRYHEGRLGRALRRTLSLGVRFCLIDAQKYGYAKRTESGYRYWYDAGEMGYLLLGMINGCEVVPEMTIADGGRTLESLTIEGLSALVELMQPHGQWQEYANKDPMAIAALTRAVRLWPDHPAAKQWQSAAVTAADSWLAVGVDPADYPGEVIHFGSMRREKDEMSYLWDWTDTDPGRTFVVFYISGHWIHALAEMYGMTGNEAYRTRAEAMVGYLCGANPWHVRLLNELGGVYNYVEDTDGDGIEDLLRFDLYPESTAFCQIGITRLIEAVQERSGRSSGARRQTIHAPK